MIEMNHMEQSSPWLQRLVLFAIAFVFWLALAWPVSPADGSIMVGDVVAGVVVAAVVALVMREIIRVNFIRLLNPRCWFWGVVYVFVFFYYVVKGGVDVAYRVLHPDVPIRPGIIRVRSTLKTQTGLTALANSITLTPGTLTIDVTGEGVFYVHWLYVLTQEDEEAAHKVLRRFEWFIQRIFE